MKVVAVVLTLTNTPRYQPDPLLTLNEQQIGYEGMKIDRMLFKKFEDRIKMDDIIKKNVELGNWEHVVSHIQQEIFDKPEEYFNLEKLRKAAKIDRKVSIREVVEKIFGIIPKFKSKDELLGRRIRQIHFHLSTRRRCEFESIKIFFQSLHC